MSTGLLFLIVACFAGAWVDAIAGGGGLITLPAYMIAGVPAHFALGTNKFASSWGTLMASAKFAKEKAIELSLIKYLIPTAFLGAVLGVRCVLFIDPQVLAPLVMVLILAVGGYTFFSETTGREDQYRPAESKSIALGMLGSFVLGFYDGFFGPGTGTFLVFVFMKLFRFDFVHANANAKPVNLASNLASLFVFAFSGKILFAYGIPIAAAMMLGGYLGARCSLKNGNRLIKPLFVLMALGASIRLFYQYMERML